jgi:hypothetical protein
MPTYTISEPLTLEVDLFGSSASFDAFAVYYETIAPAIGQQKPGSVEWYEPVRAWLAKTFQVDAAMIHGNQVEEFVAAVHKMVDEAVTERKKKVALMLSLPLPIQESPPTIPIGPLPASKTG